MRATTDYIVRSADNRTQLVVEVKAVGKSDPLWAASLRRNLFAHAQIPPAPYFLLALPDRFYLWKDATLDAVPPHYEVPSNELLRPYINRIAVPLENLSEQSFELIVRSWLDDVIAGNATAGKCNQLQQLGLYEAIKDGVVDTQMAV